MGDDRSRGRRREREVYDEPVRIDPEKMRIAKHGEQDAQHSVTFYATIDKVAPRLAWLSMKPITGRTHQLRAHAEAIGHPIIGDPKYTGGFAPNDPRLTDPMRAIPREIERKLHLLARRLVLPNPSGGMLDVDGAAAAAHEEDIRVLWLRRKASTTPSRKRRRNDVEGTPGPCPEGEYTEAQKAAHADFLAVRRSTSPARGTSSSARRSCSSRPSAMGEFLRYRCSLSGRLSELAILLVAATGRRTTNGARIASMRSPPAWLRRPSMRSARGAGPSASRTKSKACHDFVSEILNTRRVSDTTYERAKALFGETGVIDLCGITGYYQLLALTMNVARTPAPEGEQPLPRFPNRAQNRADEARHLRCRRNARRQPELHLRSPAPRLRAAWTGAARRARRCSPSSACRSCAPSRRWRRTRPPRAWRRPTRTRGTTCDTIPNGTTRCFPARARRSRR